MFTIKTAAEELELTEHYVRKCIREEKLEAELVPVPDMEGVERYEISPEALEAFRNRPRTGGARSDGRNKFNIYLSPEEEKALRPALRELGMEEVEHELRRSNPPKA